MRILSRRDTFSNEWVKVTNFYLRLGKYFLLSRFTFDYSFCNWDWPSRTDAASRDYTNSTLSFPHFSSFDFQKEKKNELKEQRFQNHERRSPVCNWHAFQTVRLFFIFEKLIRQIDHQLTINYFPWTCWKWMRNIFI